MNVKQAYQSLNEEQLSILKTKVITGRYKPKALVKLLRELVTYDRLNDSKRESLQGVTTFTGVLGFIVLVVAFFVGLSTESFTIGFSVAGVAMFLFLVCFICSSKVTKLKQNDLANEMRRVLFPFALTMQEEAKAGSKLAIELDANEPTLSKFLKDSKLKHGTYGRSIRTYRQRWLSASLTLIDDTALFIDCDKTVYEIQVVKRSASGKTKHKLKIKSRDDVVIKALIPKQQYELSGREDSPDIHIEERDDVFAVRGKYKFKTQDVKTLQVQTVFDLVHRMYSHVTPISPST